MPLLTFIVPIRHPQNARDWGALCARLQQTLASIANQSHPGWSCVVVANEGAALPPLPPGVSTRRVSFPPNDMHELDKGPREAVYEAFRLDKGRRVLAGMMAAPDSRFFMVVDDDDLVSNAIAAHVARHPEANGWHVDQGFLWNDGGSWFLRIRRFDGLCGSSLIIRRDLYGLPEREDDAPVDWIRSMLGSHIKIKPILAERGTPLAPLPFAGAVYRVGSADSHSQAPGILRMRFFNRGVLRDPRRLPANLLRLRPISPALRREFFGDAPAAQPGP